MNKEERTELVFETLSKIAGFEIKPSKDFYILTNGHKMKHHINENLTLMREVSKGHYKKSIFTIFLFLTDDYQLEEIKEPLLTEEGKNFLRQFKFEELEKTSTYLNMYNNNRLVAITSIHLINLSLDGLEKGKKYSREELGL